MAMVRKATIMALITAAGILLIVGVNVYQNFYQQYAILTVTQLEPAFLPPPPPGTEYARMPDSVYDELPKIRSVFAEVQNKYREVLSNCPPKDQYTVT